jgi:hypothetical protein
MSEERPSQGSGEKAFLFRNFGPENPKNMVINNQWLHADELDHRRLVY